MRHSRDEDLVRHIIENPEKACQDGSMIQLLEEYYSGASLQSLTTLLNSDDDCLVGEAAWIASELSYRITEVWPQLFRLLHHRSEKVRFWVVLCGQSIAESLNPGDLAEVISAISDHASTVRWQAMVTISKLSASSLLNAMPFIKESQIASMIEIVVHPCGDPVVEVTKRISSSDWYERAAGALIAARMALQDTEALEIVRSADDAELASFASDMYQRATA
jgi:hypothetical protein